MKLDRQQVNGLIVKVFAGQITRVVTEVSKDRKQVQRADTLDDAVQKGVRPEVVYIRDDGWTLGAPNQFAVAAHGLWTRDYVAAVSLVTGDVEFYG